MTLNLMHCQVEINLFSSALINHIQLTRTPLNCMSWKLWKWLYKEDKKKRFPRIGLLTVSLIPLLISSERCHRIRIWMHGIDSERNVWADEERRISIDSFHFSRRRKRCSRQAREAELRRCFAAEPWAINRGESSATASWRGHNGGQQIGEWKERWVA